MDDTLLNEMKADPNIRILRKSAASDFLLSREFVVALGQTQGISPDDMLRDDFTSPEKEALIKWMNEGTNSPWSEVSKNFVAATTGEVRIMTSLPRMRKRGKRGKRGQVTLIFEC